MKEDELLEQLARLRRANMGAVRAPHKPLLLLWLFGRFAASGTSAVPYAEAEEPVSHLINEFGPPVASLSAQRQRAAMPFVHLERDLWELRDGMGAEIGSDVPERRGWLLDHQVHGRLRPEVERLLSTPSTLTTAVRLLLDRHFTPTLGELICATVGLEPTATEQPVGTNVRRIRTAGFAEQVLRAYAYSCAICGFDGALGRNPVGLQAAHIRWHSQGGPDDIANATALCVLHHTLLDLGVLGLTHDLQVRGIEAIRGPKPDRTGRPRTRRTSAQRPTARPAHHQHRPHHLARQAGLQRTLGRVSKSGVL